MNAVSKVGLQNQPTNISQNAKVSYMRQSDQPKEDTVTISNPAFKGKQIIVPKQMDKAKLALVALAATFFGGIAAKANAKLEVEAEKAKELEKKVQIAKMAEELGEYRFDPDSESKHLYIETYSKEEAKGIAQFMFDKPVFDELKERLHHENQWGHKLVTLSYDEIMYLGEQLKKNKDVVNKLSVNNTNYKDVVKLLKLHEVNPKEVEELNNDFKNISVDEVEKVADTYKNHPEKTKRLLGVQNEIREIKAKVAEEQRYADYYIKNGVVTHNGLREKISNDIQRLVDIAPEYIKEEVKPMLKEFNDTNAVTFPCDRIPDIGIEDIISAINSSPVKDLKSLL